MLIGSRIVTRKQLANLALLVLSLAAFVWVGHDALDGDFTFCARYSFGCAPLTAAGTGVARYWTVVCLFLAMPAVLALLAWHGLRERARDRYR